MLRVPQQKEQRESSSDRHLRDRQTLTVALDWMAEYLRQKGQNLEVIIIGHATTSLLSAQSAGTDDVDFFGTNLTNSQRRFLDEAAQYAREKMNNRLKYGWFNNLALLNLPWEVHRKATYTAVVQNECMYNGEGLKLLAADWMFALCGKLDSLATARGQGLQRQMEIDRIGAAIYLNRYIARWKQGPIPAGDIIRQAELYQTPLSEDFLSAIKEVRDKYKQMFFFDGIVGI